MDKFDAILVDSNRLRELSTNDKTSNSFSKNALTVEFNTLSIPIHTHTHTHANTHHSLALIPTHKHTYSLSLYLSI